MHKNPEISRRVRRFPVFALVVAISGCAASHERWARHPNCGVGPDDLVSPPQAVCLAIAAARDHGNHFPDMAYVDRIGKDDDSAMWVVRVEQAGAEQLILKGGTVDGATVFIEERGGEIVSYQPSPFRQREP